MVFKLKTDFTQISHFIVLRYVVSWMMWEMRRKIFLKHFFSHFAGVNVEIIIDIFSCFPIIWLLFCQNILTHKIQWLAHCDFTNFLIQPKEKYQTHGFSAQKFFCDLFIRKRITLKSTWGDKDSLYFVGHSCSQNITDIEEKDFTKV